MSVSLGDIFKTGDFWSNLEGTVKSIKKRIKANSKYISKLEAKNNIEVV